MMTANGLSSSVACTHACRPRSGLRMASAPLSTCETSSIWRPATPPWALMSATTAFIVVSALPISGARFCSVSWARSAEIIEILIGRVGEPDGVADARVRVRRRGVGGGAALGRVGRAGRREQTAPERRSPACDASSASSIPPDTTSSDLSELAPKPSGARPRRTSTLEDEEVLRELKSSFNRDLRSESRGRSPIRPTLSPWVLVLGLITSSV